MYNKSIEMGFESSHLYSMRGLTLYALGNRAEALESLNKAIAMDNSNAEAYFNKSVLCADMGDIVNALDCLKKAVGLNPEYKSIALQLSQFNALHNMPEFWAIVG
jgi:tetratricopeptide (TPR) repeat protein